MFSEFKLWKEEPTLDRNCNFLEKIYREDIFPCLTFNKSEVYFPPVFERLHVAQNKVAIITTNIQLGQAC